MKPKQRPVWTTHELCCIASFFFFLGFGLGGAIQSAVMPTSNAEADSAPMLEHE